MNESDVSKQKQQFQLIPKEDRCDKWLKEENYLP